MKRDKNLVPLSWDHHDGLAVALKILNGLKSGKKENKLKDYFLYHWENHLNEHFRKEEEWLLPLVEEKSPQLELCIRLLSEHLRIRGLAGQLKNNGNKNLMNTLAKTIQAHIRFEERQFFPFVEKLLSGTELAGLGELLHQHYKQADKSFQEL